MMPNFVFYAFVWRWSDNQTGFAKELKTDILKRS